MTEIRKLTGKSARDYTIQLESDHTLHEIIFLNKIAYELRARFMEFMKLDLKYFHQRHRYTPVHRRVLDLFVISAYDNEMDVRLNNIGIITDLRIKYLKHLYRKELNKNHEWVRVTDSNVKNTIYVWHEDVEDYYKQI